jgi:hypothetical protein
VNPQTGFGKMNFEPLPSTRKAAIGPASSCVASFLKKTISAFLRDAPANPLGKGAGEPVSKLSETSPW